MLTPGPADTWLFGLPLTTHTLLYKGIKESCLEEESMGDLIVLWLPRTCFSTWKFPVKLSANVCLILQLMGSFSVCGLFIEQRGNEERQVKSWDVQLTKEKCYKWDRESSLCGWASSNFCMDVQGSQYGCSRKQGANGMAFSGLTLKSQMASLLRHSWLQVNLSPPRSEVESRPTFQWEQYQGWYWVIFGKYNLPVIKKICIHFYGCHNKLTQISFLKNTSYLLIL